MSTITNVALNFTKEELIARLRAVLPIAKERDKKAVAEHRAAERAFTASDVKLLRFLGDLARIAANNQHVSPTWIDDMRRVGAQVVDNPAILDRPYVFVAFDGTVTEHPAYGWVIAQGDNQ